MTLHLLKMCVGVDSIDHLRQLQAQRLERQRAAGEPAELRHVTRNMPRRADEILDGGSLYWIIKGQIRARQRIVSLERLDKSNTLKRCAIVLDPRIVETQHQRARPMQGWRYLNSADAPNDALRISDDAAPEMPPQMVAELRELGLL